MTIRETDANVILREISEAKMMIQNRSVTEKTFELKKEDFYPFMTGWLNGILTGVQSMLKAAE